MKKSPLSRSDLKLGDPYQTPDPKSNIFSGSMANEMRGGALQDDDELM